MRHFFLLFSILSVLFIFSCDDGDVFTVEFDFNDEFSECGESDLLLYKTKEAPSETLSVLIPNFKIEEVFESENDTIEKTNATFNYRTYNREDLPNDLFCNSIPPANLNVAMDESSPCIAKFIRTLVEDDRDGIPTEFENPDPNGDGNFDDAQDTDGDGIPDYLDEDDDGDNVPTRSENPDPDNDENPQDAQDTDGDSIPDYLDDDDDGDGVLTRDEENESQNQNPQDDETNSEVGEDYLNPAVKTVVPATAYRKHTIYQTYTVLLIVEDISLGILSQDVLSFGTLTGNSALNDTKEITPDF